MLHSIKNHRLSISLISSIKNNNINNNLSQDIHLIRNLEGLTRDHLMPSVLARLLKNIKHKFGIEKLIWGKLTRVSQNYLRLEIQEEEPIIDCSSNKLHLRILHLHLIISSDTNLKKCCLPLYETRQNHLIDSNLPLKDSAEIPSR